MSLRCISKGRRFISLKHHLWYRPVSPASSRPPSNIIVTPDQNSANTSKAWSVEIGLTSRGLEDIGDVLTVTEICSKGSIVEAGSPILKLDWDGHLITSADELYHTVWETIEGETVIHSPLQGTVEFIETHPGIEEEDVLVSISTVHDSLQRAIANLMDEEEYNEHVRTLSSGTFGRDPGLYF
jgi:glycine cleavage system H lipoate-binding protein